MTDLWFEEIEFPVLDPGQRKFLVKMELCPECGTPLDVGWECNNWKCGFDARPLAYSEMDKVRIAKEKGKS